MMFRSKLEMLSMLPINATQVCNSSLIGLGPAIVRYYGTTHFASGYWLGLELPEALGSHNGTVGGKSYFNAPPNCGMVPGKL